LVKLHYKVLVPVLNCSEASVCIHQLLLKPCLKAAAILRFVWSDAHTT